jgi:hypothetical protein
MAINTQVQLAGLFEIRDPEGKSGSKVKLYCRLD